MSLTPQDIDRIIRIEAAGHKVSDHLDMVLPEQISLSYLSELCGRSRDAIRKHLLSHYREDRDYIQKVKGGKIHIVRTAALTIRKHYVQ